MSFMSSSNRMLWFIFNPTISPNSKRTRVCYFQRTSQSISCIIHHASSIIIHHPPLIHLSSSIPHISTNPKEHLISPQPSHQQYPTTSHHITSPLTPNTHKPLLPSPSLHPPNLQHPRINFEIPPRAPKSKSTAK